jgi:hypothetical protein
MISQVLMWIMRGAFWLSATRKVGIGRSPIAARFSAVEGFKPKYFRKPDLIGQLQNHIQPLTKT